MNNNFGRRRLCRGFGGEIETNRDGCRMALRALKIIACRIKREGWTIENGAIARTA